MEFARSTNHRHPIVVRHQGMPIVLALDENRDIYYRVLALDPAQPDDDKSWSERRKLSFPNQIRPAGMSLVTLALKMAGRTAAVPFQAVSDGKHVYVFRQSIDNTLYVDRFVFDPATGTLNASWEARFQRNRKRDLPASRKDTLGARDMEGEPFYEPTTELTVVNDLHEGRFCVLLLPGRLPSQWRWQIFVTNSAGEIDSFSIRRGEDGLFDVADVRRTCLKWADVGQRFQTGPAALLYMQQEEAQDEYGRPQRVKRGARVMLAAPVGASRYALELDGADDFVSLGNPESLQGEGAITVEAWVQVQATGGRRDIVAHGTGGVSLRIQEGQYHIGVGTQCASYAIPQEDVGTWIHLAGVYDSEQGAWLLFHNGTQVAQQADPTGAVAVEEDWVIGRAFAGQINNVRLWGRARTGGEIAQDMHRPLAEDEHGLVGDWPFDESSGDWVSDRASENHGRLHVGCFLAFDGLDDYVTLPAMDLDFTNGFTVEARVLYRSFQSWSRIIDFGNGAPGDNLLFANEGTTNDLVLQVYQGQEVSTLTAPGVLEVDTWVHLAATVDADGQAAIYKDGQRLVTGTVHVPRTVERAQNYLGRSNWGADGYFDGGMREVRVWNVARSEAEIRSTMDKHLSGDEADLVGYWPLDEGAGGAIYDRASGNHGWLRLGHALYFDGLDDYVDVVGDGGAGTDQAITVEAWVKHLGGNGHIVNRGGGWSESGYSLFIWDGQIRVELQDASRREKTIVDNPLPADGAWHHLAFTWDSASTTVKTYCDGELQPKTGIFRGPIGTPRQPLNIGRNALCGYPFRGGIGDVRLWNVPRTQDEILHDMHGPPAGDAHGLVGFWLFEEGAGETLRNRASGNDGQLRVGYAKDSHTLVLDGVDDYVHIEGFEWPAGGPVTVEFWARVNAADVRDSSAFTVGAQNIPNRFHVHLPQGKRRLYWDYGDFGGTGRLDVDYSPYLDRWTHVALVSEGNDGKLMGIYLNGKLVASKPSSDGPDELLKGLWIGKWDLAGIHKGAITDFRIWDHVRSADDIQANMHRRLAGNEDGLVGYWPLDEGAGETIHDQTSAEQHGQLVVGAGDALNAKWGVGPIPADSLDKKWGEGPDRPDEKWREGVENPDDKWVVVPPIAILDFGVSRDGTLALIGDLKDHSEVTLTLNGVDFAATLPIPIVESGAGQAAMPMSTIAVDQKGLAISAGLLNFAHSGDTPFLLDGAEGLVHLYFRGDYGQFLVAQYDTLAARAEYILSLDGADEGPRLHFTARRPGAQMEGYEIAIADGPDSQTCLVNIGNRTGIRETWQKVPRDLEPFLAVLNGTASNDARDPLVREGTLVFYDYGSNVQREGVPDLTASDNPFFGSTLFAVGAYHLPDTGVPIALRNVDPIEFARQPGKDCAWIPEPQGMALEFDGADDLVTLPHDKLAITGDLTVEAWVKVADGAGSDTPLRLINCHSEGPRFTLGLVKDTKSDGYKVFAASEEKATQTPDALVLPEAWTHVAAVYNATNALNLDGQGYVDCGNDVTLDMPQAMTVEAWVTPKKARNQREQKEVILSKWGMSEAEQSWRLYIDTDDKPCFETRDSQQKLIRVKANLPLEAGRSYHLAGVFDAAPRAEVALEFDGGRRDYVQIPDHDNIDFGKDQDFTVAAWIKPSLQQKDTQYGDNDVIEKWSGSGGYPYVIRYNNHTTGANEGTIVAARYDGVNNPRVTSTTRTNDGAFHHVAFVKRGSQLALYVDGFLEDATEDITTSDTRNNSPLFIGSRGGTRNFFSGQINNVRIWNQALSIEEIRDDMDRPALEVQDAVGHWAFDELDKQAAVGGQVRDRSGRGNDGVLKGGLKADAFVKVDKCRYEQKLLVDGDLRGCRWVAIDSGKAYGFLSAKLTPFATTFTLMLYRSGQVNVVNVGDCLLLQEEQVHVVRVAERTGHNKSYAYYDLVVKRAINCIVQEHRADTQIHFLKREANEVALTPTRVNIGRSASDEGYFQGIVDDVRLWGVGRRDWQIQYYRDRPLPGNAEGLVSDWRFEEGRGQTAIDFKGSNHGRLVHPKSDAIAGMWLPAARNARLTVYVNGRPVQSTEQPGSDRFGGYGLRGRFTIGALIGEDETPQQPMSGSIDEVRVWNRVRSPEQIRDTMYRALSGAEEGLAGYWPLDEGAGEVLRDQTGNGQEGILVGPQWIDSTAPIGNEGPEVRNVCGGLAKPGFNKQIEGSPVAVEYCDMQWDDEGNLFGVMKRCYGFQKGALQLVTGFKVGDLELNFIGQVQTAPTLIGYIEGAPPVPSENLTVNDPKTDDYVGTSIIQLTEAKETTQVYSASRDTGFDMSVEFKAGYHWGTGVYAGLGVQTKVFSSEGKVGLHAYFEHSTGFLSTVSRTAGASKTLTKSLTLGGGWEEARDYDQNGQARYLNPDVGRRYLPNNMGYALVKSTTADLFALRLKRTGSLVAFQVLPNPDIPEDWNIIMFPLNPKYVKNGSLDGMVGLVADPDYPDAIAGERGSYFKPLEAYALQERIEREAKKIAGYYATFEAGKIGRREAAIHFQEGDPGDARRALLDVLPQEELGYDWETGKDRRNMVNTYVWTADGGFYAEEEQFSSIRQESEGGSYHFLGKAGLYADVKLAAGAGFFFEIDALFGGHINTTVSKSKEEKAAFGLHVDVKGEGFLNRWQGDPDKRQGFYTAEPCPGKVDAYRFMTFYLAPKPQNFDQFFEEIVDPEWLNGQGKYAGEYGPNARALREARFKPNEVWRVLHRVTYVSRIPPRIDSTPVEAVPRDVRRPANIEANIGLIREIERIKRSLPSNLGESHLMILGRAVDRLLLGDVSGGGQVQSELEKMVSWWAGSDEALKREIRQDLMAYLKAFYESDLVVPEREEDGNDGAGVTTYIVQAGDSLSAIARKFYGDGRRWRTIFAANKATIKNPNLIRVGQQLIIPR